MRGIKLSDVKRSDVFGLGSLWAGVFEAFGLEDGDLPDIIPDDIDFDDITQVERCFPIVFKKLKAVEEKF